VKVLETKTQTRIGHLVVWASRNFHLTCFDIITQAWILPVKGFCNTAVSILYSSFSSQVQTYKNQTFSIPGPKMNPLVEAYLI
jgi:hypothetical protein